MDTLYWLDQIQPSQRAAVGNQAFILSQLLQRDYPVVPGFVIPAIAFWEFIDTLGESEPMLADLPYSSFHVDVDNPRQLQQVAQQIRREITTAALSPTWRSLLSTATEVWQAPAMIFHPSLSLPSTKKYQISRSTVEGLSEDEATPLLENNLQLYDLEPVGILKSHIGWKQPASLEHSLKRVWAELFRARSLFYWQRHEIGLQQLSLAVLVQPVWDAIASGSLLTNQTEWNIQATYGLGEALTQGEVLPDNYQLQAGTGIVKTQSLGSKTRVYRLSHPKESSQVPESSLQVYSLSEEQQKQYALEEKFLKQLINLSQRLTAELGPAFSFEWSLYQFPDSLEPQIFLTRFIHQPRAISPMLSRSTQAQSSSLIPQIIRGLPAAPGRITAPAQVIIGESQNPEAMLPGRILVTPSIALEWLPRLKKAAGVITEQGGITSHAAILARELGIPAVVGAVGVTQLIQTGELIDLDGDQGEIHRAKDSSSETERSRQLTSYSILPPIATQLMVNVSQPSSLARIEGLPIDGVGLLRSELMMLEALENRHPSEWLRQGLKSELVARLAQLITQFAAVFAPRPVFYRSLDWRSHEFQFLAGNTSVAVPEVNPILGLRGTRSYLVEPTYFDLELRALGQVQAQGYTNVNLLLPFVRAVEEFTFCRRRVEQSGLMENPHFQLWIMAEVPSVLFLLPDYVKAGVQGISIGSNDLTQLLLATERDQEQLGSKLDGRHPVVKWALEQLIQAARTANIPCSICGQAPAQYPELVDLLVRWGITSISVDVNDVESTYSAIARAEQRLLLEAARQNISNR